MEDIKKKKFIKNGYVQYKNLLSEQQCRLVLEKIYKIKKYRRSNLFLSEKQFLKDASFEKKNPGKKINNILLNKSLNFDFIFKNKKIDKIFTEILGEKYKIDLSKIVMGVPEKWVPSWVKKKLSSLGSSNNLNPFLKEKYRDVTCYLGAEYHQDSIDYSGTKALKSKTFVVMYVYLSDVLETDAPIYILPTTHTYGAQQFPHDIVYKKNKIYYNIKHKKKISLKEIKLVGKAGTIFFWHSLLLHKTTTVKNYIPRISLKVVAERNQNTKSFISNIDKKISNKLILKNPLKYDWRSDRSKQINNK